MLFYCVVPLIFEYNRNIIVGMFKLDFFQFTSKSECVRNHGLVSLSSQALVLFLDLPFSISHTVKILFVFLISSVNEVVKKSFPDFFLTIIHRTNWYLFRNYYPVEAQNIIQQFWMLVWVAEAKQFAWLCHPSGKVRVGQFTQHEHVVSLASVKDISKKSWRNFLFALFLLILADFSQVAQSFKNNLFSEQWNPSAKQLVG